MPIPAGNSTPIDYTTPVGQVRLLINDTQPTDLVFSDTEITTFLALEHDVVKLAAAQALDVIADDEALTSKVIRTQDLATDGAKVADSLRKRAAALREQAANEDGFFELVDQGRPCTPELTERPYVSPAYGFPFFGNW